MAMTEGKCQDWFAKFSRKMRRSGRPIDETHIKTIIDSDRQSKTREIAEKINV